MLRLAQSPATTQDGANSHPPIMPASGKVVGQRQRGSHDITPCHFETSLVPEIGISHALPLTAWNEIKQQRNLRTRGRRGD